MSINQEKEPCWLVVCDGCGEVMDNDELGILHHEDHAAALRACTDYDWRVERTANGEVVRITCPVCVDGSNS
jgi:hypothetical protein